MAGLGGLGHRLYVGDVSYDFVGRRKVWYLVSGTLVLLSIVLLLVKPINWGIEFSGGSVFELQSASATVSQATQAMDRAGVADPTVQKIGEARIRITTADLSVSQTTKVQDELAKEFDLATPDDVSVSSVGPAWGTQITKKAVQGLVIFLVLVIVYLSVRFEWKMAAAAIVALVHDLVLTAGVYALVGFEVTPATVIALLTILGYSLYDTVVVFDKVTENTSGLAGGSRMTYSQAANLAVNQTLVRSINTSVIALLPVAALLIVGAGILGAGTLKDLALALLIGLAAGAYSSIFIATPLLCDMKEREPALQALRRRVEGRQGRPAARTTTAAKAGGSQTAKSSTATAVAVAERATGPGADPAAGSEVAADPDDDSSAASAGSLTQPAPPRPERPHRTNKPTGGNRRGGRPSQKRRR